MARVDGIKYKSIYFCRDVLKLWQTSSSIFLRILGISKLRFNGEKHPKWHKKIDSQSTSTSRFEGLLFWKFLFCNLIHFELTLRMRLHGPNSIRVSGKFRDCHFWNLRNILFCYWITLLNNVNEEVRVQMKTMPFMRKCCRKELNARKWLQLLGPVVQSNPGLVKNSNC